MTARRPLAVLLALLLLVSGCATVPSGGDPIDYTQVADPGTQVRDTTPAADLSPQEIVRGFVAAGARIDQDLPLLAARSFLTDAAKSSWRTDQGGVMILSASPRYDVVDGADDQVRLSGSTDGYLASDGSYVPTPRTEFSVVMDLAPGRRRVADREPAGTAHHGGQRLQPRLHPARGVLPRRRRHRGRAGPALAAEQLAVARHAGQPAGRHAHRRPE